MRKTVRLAERVISASRATRISKASRLGIIVSAVLTFLIFAVSYYGEVVGNFTFTVDRVAQNAGITLYENYDLKDYTSRLISDKVENAEGMTSLCGTEYSEFPLGSTVCLPTDAELSMVDGPFNGESFIAYTFYVENGGDAIVDVSSRINIIQTARGAEEALRVRVYIDGIGITYAKRQSTNGTAPGELEPLTESFYSLNEVMYQEFTEFKPGDVMKVTIIIWYEGEDADHTLSLVGGGVKMDMQFSIIRVYGEEDL